MEPRQSDNSDLGQWVNRVYFPEPAESSHPLPPLPNSNNIGTSGTHVTQHNTFSRTPAGKRYIEPTANWSKRQKKNEQTASTTHTRVSGSYPQQHEPQYQVKGYPYPGHPYQPVEASLPSTQTASYHDNAWHQPTPPSTDLGIPGASSSPTVAGDQFNRHIHSTTAFAYPTYDQMTYRPPQNVKSNERFPENQFRYGYDEPQLPFQDGSPFSAIGGNQVLAMQHHSHLTSSQDGHDQTIDSMQVAPSNEAPFKPLDTEEDSYFVGESDEEEMAQLADLAHRDAHQIPPFSVIRDMDGDSTVEVFDLSLQRSSPRNGREQGDGDTRTDEGYFQDEDLLSSDVDWGSVFESVPSRSRSMSSQDTALKAGPTIGNKTLTAGVRSGSYGSNGTPGRIQSTRQRLPVPSPIVGKSPPTGNPSTSKMQTFFRLGELVNEGKRRFYSKKPGTFELYAWVTNSWRERDSKVQYFQFMDLFKEQRLDLRGTLSGWRTGEVLDVQSSAFLYTDDRANSKLCRCVCRVFQDHKIGMGWFLVVIWIREATWDEVSSKEGFTTPTW